MKKDDGNHRNRAQSINVGTIGHYITFITRVVLFLKKRCLIHEKSHLVHDESCLRKLRSAIEILLRENQSEVSLYPIPKQRMPPIKLTMP